MKKRNLEKNQLILISSCYTLGKVRPITNNIKKIIAQYLSPFFYNSLILDLFSGKGSLFIDSVKFNNTSSLLIEHNIANIYSISLNTFRSCKNSNYSYFKDQTLLFLSGYFKYKFNLLFIDPPFSYKLTPFFWKNIYQWISFSSIIILRYSIYSNISIPNTFSIKNKKIYGNQTILFIKKI